MTSLQMSSPWGKAAVVAPCSLEDIMTEQLAVQLQKEDDDPPQTPNVEPFVQLQETADLMSGAEGISPEDMAAILAAQGLEAGGAAEGQGQGHAEETTDDEMIARMMQLQFDREHNAMLDREASKLNGSSKVRLSFDNYKTQHPVQYDDECDDDDEDIDEPVSKWEEKTPKIGSKGYVGSGKNITTKHDKVICGRKNAERLMAFPPEFDSGDGEGIDMQLTNRVYNKLKNHSRSEQKHRARETESKDHSTAVKSVDPKTRMLLFKLVSSGLLESLGGCIAEGKESTVFEGKGGSEEEVPDKVVVKVFKTTLTDFRTREKYVNGDHRFSSTYKKTHLRKIIKVWAMKEVANLNRLQRHDVPCPRVVMLRKHVLVMSMIGGDKPAPKLRYITLSTADLYDAYEQTVQIMKNLHQKCGLVHADLSAYNLLWHAGKVHVIDVSQSVELTHPNALQFLLRDCTNISTYFQKQRLHGVLSPEELFNEVTGLDFKGEGGDFKAQVQRYDREKKEWNIVLQQSDSQFGFDYFFDKATAERERENRGQNQSQSLQEDKANGPPSTSSPCTSTLQASHSSLKAIVHKYVQESDNDSSSEEDEDNDDDDAGDDVEEREESASLTVNHDNALQFEESISGEKLH